MKLYFTDLWTGYINSLKPLDKADTHLNYFIKNTVDENQDVAKDFDLCYGGKNETLNVICIPTVQKNKL